MRAPPSAASAGVGAKLAKIALLNCSAGAVIVASRRPARTLAVLATVAPDPEHGKP